MYDLFHHEYQTMQTYYNSIDIEGIAPAPHSTFLSGIYQRAWHIGELCVKLLGAFFGILIIILLLFAAYVMLGIIVVVLDSAFEIAIVYLFGRDTFNKNFPICTNTVYSGNNCHTTTRTYCT